MSGVLRAGRLLRCRKVLPWVVGAVLCVALVACAPQPQQADGSSGDVAASSASKDSQEGAAGWSMDMDCTACHSDQAQALIAEHNQAGGDGSACGGCHQDTEVLQAVHDEKMMSGKAPKRLRKTDVGDATCESCHGIPEQLASATEGVALTDTEGTTVNPHAAYSLNDDHVQAFACRECHSVHGDADAMEQAEVFCSDCHHRGVFACGTCHE